MLLLWRCIATLNDILAIFIGRGFQGTQRKPALSLQFMSPSQWNLIIGSGRIVENKIDTKITLSDNVNQKNIPAKFASIRPWSFSEEEWRWTQSDDNSPNGQTKPSKKNIHSKQNKVQRQIT